MAVAKTPLTDQLRRGRRTLLTAELQERICALIRQGAYDYAAAEACGISRNTFFEWLARGEDRDEQRRGNRVFAGFASAVRRARAEARALAEIQIKKIDPKWWLSRMHRDKPGEPAWSNPQRTELPQHNDETLSMVGIKAYLRQVAQAEEERRAAIDVTSELVAEPESEN